jgi:hypothetical protein
MNAKDGRKNQACKLKAHKNILSLNNSLKGSQMIWETQTFKLMKERLV